jgi:hypothetical protein
MSVGEEGKGEVRIKSCNHNRFQVNINFDYCLFGGVAWPWKNGGGSRFFPYKDLKSW